MILNMGRLLRQTVLRFSNKTAIINIERDRRFSFMELHKLTNKVCNILEDKFNLGKDDVFATLLENDNMSLFHFWMAKSLCTGLWLGIRDSRQEHFTQIDYVEPKVIFIETDLLPEYLEELTTRKIIIVCMDKPDVLQKGVYYYWDLVETASDDEVNIEYVADDTEAHCFLFKFTGGTTADGKCAMYSVANFIFAGFNSIQSSEIFPYDYPKALVATPITHAAGSIMLPVFFKGGTIITLNSADIKSMGKIIEDERVELIYTVPTVLYRMLEMELTKHYDLSSLKTIRYGASPISPSKLEKLVKEFGLIFVQGYGSTEAWVPLVILGRKDHDIQTENDKKKLLSVGRPVPGIEVQISDDDGNELPIGKEGEIWVRGPHVIQGYYKDRKQTEKNFSKNGFWKSGDIGYMDTQGYIYLMDRKKDMIITGGFNVYANEVENCLHSHPAIEISAVVGIPDEDWGESVYAEVVLKKGKKISEHDLILFCKQHLAKYKAPKKIQFVDELPLSAVSKVLRRKIKEKFWKNEKRLVH